MTVTLSEAVEQLNISVPADTDELQLYIDAANEWMGTKVTTTQDADYPHLAKLATLLLIDHLWGSQRGPAATPLAGDELVTISGVGFAIPNRVLELIDAIPGRKASPSYSFPDAVSWPDSVEALAP